MTLLTVSHDSVFILPRLVSFHYSQQTKYDDFNDHKFTVLQCESKVFRHIGHLVSICPGRWGLQPRNLGTKINEGKVIHARIHGELDDFPEQAMLLNQVPSASDHSFKNCMRNTARAFYVNHHLLSMTHCSLALVTNSYNQVLPCS